MEDQLYEHYRFNVDPGQSSIRIDKYLLDKIERISRNKIQKAATDNYILVNDKAVKSNYKVRPNDVIVIMLPREPTERHSILPEDIPLDIIYEDESLMVINKPAGLVVHPGIGNYSGTLVNAVAFHLKRSDLPIKEGNEADRPGIVHRIDKDTTGLMVIAKSEHAMTHLSKQFFDHTIERTYHALVWGNFDETEGTIDAYIGRHPTARLQMYVHEERDQGKHAITHYKVLKDYYYVSLVECRLETGRTHQIRVHMKYAGHPLFNDWRYNGNRIWKGTVFTKYRRFVENCFDVIPRQALHAYSLGFIHPETGEKMHFTCPLPDDFQAVIDKWEHYLSSRKDKK